MNAPGAKTPEEKARIVIDGMLGMTGWIVQNRDVMNLHTTKGVAVREFPLNPDHVDVYYLLSPAPGMGKEFYEWRS